MQGTEVELELDSRLRREAWWFDAHEADRVCFFFEEICRHSKGEWAGLPLILAPWQRKHIRRLFGWRRPDGTRRYRRSAWWVPRKNGKSTIAAGMGNYLTFADGEPGAEIYSVATSKDQAEAVFGEAKNMVEASTTLSAIGTVYKTSIYVPLNGSSYKVLSAKPRTKHGFNVHGVLIDELHAQKDRELYDVLTTAAGSRRQPLEFVISTAGNDVGHFSYEIWEYCKKVISGVFEAPDFLPVVYAAEAGDDWQDPEVWKKANPGYGISVKPEYLEAAFEQTKGQPGRIAAFKQLHLNLWSQTAEALIPIDAWRKCLVPIRPIEEFRGRRGWGGLDLSSTTDLTSLVLVFEPIDGIYDAWGTSWCPLDTIRERQKEDSAQYVKWVDQGLIRATPGNVIDYDLVERDVAAIAKVVQLEELAYDRAGASQIAQRLKDIHGITMAIVGQGMLDMSPPTKEMVRLVMARRLRVPNDEVMTWAASNVMGKRDTADTLIKPVKQRRYHRIDPIIALVMALGRATLGRNVGSVYDTRGPLVL